MWSSCHLLCQERAATAGCMERQPGISLASGHRQEDTRVLEGQKE